MNITGNLKVSLFQSYWDSIVVECSALNPMQKHGFELSLHEFSTSNLAQK